MLKFAANLTTMFREHAFINRFHRAAEAGFSGVEFLFPYDHAPADLADHQRDAEVATVLFNLPPGDWAAGDRGLAAIPGREIELRASLDIARRYIQALGV